MDQRQYIYDCRTQKARLFLQGRGLYDLQTGSQLFVVEDDWAYGVKTDEPTFWIDGRNLYLYRGGSNLAFEPSLYLGEIVREPPRLDRNDEPPTIMPPARAQTAFMVEVGPASRFSQIGSSLLRQAKMWLSEGVAQLHSLVHRIGERAYERRQERLYRRRPKTRPRSKIIWDDADARMGFGKARGRR